MRRRIMACGWRRRRGGDERQRAKHLLDSSATNGRGGVGKTEGCGGIARLVWLESPGVPKVHDSTLKSLDGTVRVRSPSP
jgi:hypothetical protein